MHTRFDLAATSCAFSACENFIASGGQDGSVKITTVSGEAATRKWKAHNGCVKGLAFDPQRRYLVSTGEDGMACVWDYSSATPESAKVWSSDMLPHTDMKLSQLNRPVWEASGSKLALPTYSGVAILERDTWKEWKRLQEHKAEVVGLDWAPTGNHMISSHADNSVVIWDLSPSSRSGGGDSLDRIKHARKVISVAWHPKRNSVALLDEDGKFALWDNVILNTGRKAANPNQPAVRPVDDYDRKKQSVSSLFGDDIVASPARPSHLEASAEAVEQDLGNTDRRTALDRLVQNHNPDLRPVSVDGGESAHVDELQPGDGMDVETAQPTAPPLKPRQAAAIVRRRPPGALGPRTVPADWSPVAKLHPSFQPNASPYAEKRRYLCWNGALVFLFPGDV